MVTQPKLAKRQKKNSDNGLQESPSAINIANNKEGTTERSGIFMAILKPTLIVSHSNKDNESVNPIATLDLYNKVGQDKNFNDYALILLQHNVQSLNNKLLDIAIMLTVDNLNVNILCFTVHWLLEDKMNVLNIDQFRLVNNFSRSYSMSGGSCIFYEKYCSN